MQLARLVPLSRPAIEGFLIGCWRAPGQPQQHAVDFDYDANRPQELKACDDPRQHGHVDQAKSCYETPDALIARPSHAG